MPPAPQVTVPFVGAVHTRHMFPHEVMLVLMTQVSPQAW
jgi:hypothetical protein